MKKRIVFGISGASGMPLAHAVLKAFSCVADLEIHAIVSHHASQVLKAECAQESHIFEKYVAKLYEADDMAAPPASGSWKHDGMIVCPCSMSSLASIAHGNGISLLHRAADVTIKERRTLILAVRESPLSPIHLRNMLTCAETGCVIMPFMPAFYQKPLCIETMMTFFAGRLLDVLGIPHSLIKRWGE